jgi:hypothetical protein
MIDKILELLRLQNYYGMSETIDIAKGINSTNVTIKQGIRTFKARKYGRKESN